jgi:hypothetical protein
MKDFPPLWKARQSAHLCQTIHYKPVMGEIENIALFALFNLTEQIFF